MERATVGSRVLGLGALVAGACAAAHGCGRVETAVGEELPGEGGAGCQPAAVYLDVASGALEGGFTIQTDPTAPGGAYLSPPPGVEMSSAPGDASAAYAFDLACSGDDLVWGRIRGPGPESNGLWVSVDDGPFYEWRLSTGVIWFWGAITQGTDYVAPIHFSLAAGSHTLVFRNETPGVGLAGIFVGPAGEVPPGNSTPCDPPNSIQLGDGGCEPSCGSQGGNACGDVACAGGAMLEAYDCVVCCRVEDGGDGVGDAGDGSAD